MPHHHPHILWVFNLIWIVDYAINFMTIDRYYCSLCHVRLLESVKMIIIFPMMQPYIVYMGHLHDGDTSASSVHMSLLHKVIGR